MAKVVISHRLHDDGMAVLEKAGADVVITNPTHYAVALKYDNKVYVNQP